MKFFALLFCCLSLSFLHAELKTVDFTQYEKAACLEFLENASDDEIWQLFTNGQLDLYFNSDSKWLEEREEWMRSWSVLGLGSANGPYLYKLASHFHDKRYTWLESDTDLLERTHQCSIWQNFGFHIGSAESFDPALSDSFDAILLRLTLQYLEDPYLALANFSHYLRQDGCLFIIDAFDSVRQTSHPVEMVESSVAQLLEAQQRKGKGNRKITMEILHSLQDEGSELAQLYELVFTNIDTEENLIAHPACFYGDQDRKKYFNHALLFSTVISRRYGTYIDLDKGYDELVEFLHDEKAWVIPGAHFLVLKKK